MVLRRRAKKARRTQTELPKFQSTEQPRGLSINETTQWLLGATSDFALLIDLEGTVLAANELLADQLKTPAARLIGDNIYSYFPEDIAEKRRAVADLIIGLKAPLHYEDTYRPGRVYETRAQPLFDKHGNVERIAVFINDITDEKESEKERLRLISAIEQSAEAFIIIDEEFMIRYVNQAFEAMTGFPSGEVRGRSVSMLYADGERDESYRDIVNTIADGDLWQGRTHNVRKDGSVIQCEKTVSPIRGRHGVHKGYVSIWRDVTREIELERQLRQAQKMEVVGTLAGGIAHDFNNILGPIILHSELGQNCLDESHPACHSFKEILQAAQRAERLVNRILNLSKQVEKDEPVPFRLSSIIKECLLLLRPVVPATISIEQDIQGKRDVVLADPARVHQIIMNLCTNATHAMEKTGGTLDIRIDVVEKSAEELQEFLLTPASEYVALHVSDSGHGIAPDNLDKIFDPFFTTKESGLGTGLGLAVVRNIVNHLGGAITVESTPNQGSLFKVYLPAFDKQPVREISVPKPFRGAVNYERIIMVDDEKALLEAARIVLEKMKYTVTTCSRSVKALQRIRSHPDRYDLALIDVTMPEMNGIELTRELLSIRPKLPVILSSGYTELISQSEAKELGVRAYIKKPYTMVKLAETIRSVLDDTAESSDK